MTPCADTHVALHYHPQGYGSMKNLQCQQLRPLDIHIVHFQEANLQVSYILLSFTANAVLHHHYPVIIVHEVSFSLVYP